MTEFEIVKEGTMTLHEYVSLPEYLKDAKVYLAKLVKERNNAAQK